MRLNLYISLHCDLRQNHVAVSKRFKINGFWYLRHPPVILGAGAPCLSRAFDASGVSGSRQAFRNPLFRFRKHDSLFMSA